VREGGILSGKVGFCNGVSDSSGLQGLPIAAKALLTTGWRFMRGLQNVTDGWAWPDLRLGFRPHHWILRELH
jgi:hypothetical protein